jgi:hypothetical protein
VDYQKLYDQEKKSTRDLNNRLDDICKCIGDTAIRLKNGRMFHALSTGPGQERARRAVEALITEFEQSIKGLQESDALVKKGRKMIHELEDRIKEVESRMEEKIVEEKTKHAMTESRMEDEKYQLRVDHQRQINRAQKEREIDKEKTEILISQMKRGFDHEKERLETLISQKESEFDYAKEQLMDGFKSSKAKILKAHEDERSRLKKDIKVLNEALVARERVKSLSDHDVMSLFSTLTESIDQIARVVWKHNRTEWKDEFLGLAKSPKKLQKNILRESLWIVLYENIFCTPFRVFGEEGRSLETQWIAAFGRGWNSCLLLLRHNADMNSSSTRGGPLQLAC